MELQLQSKPSRKSVLSEIIVKTAFEELNYWSQVWFKSKDEKQKMKQKKQENLGDVLIKSVGKLKGSGLKILQTLALHEDIISPELLKKIEKSYSQNSSMSSFVVKKLIKKEFGSKEKELFSHIDYKPIAAASIGQVHRAQLVDGRSVVLKIQYPNIQDDIQLEMHLLKKLAGLVKNELVKKTILDVAEQQLQEINYGREIKTQELFFKNQTKDYKVPKVYANISTNSIIVSQAVEGRDLFYHKQQATQLESSVFQDIFNFYFKSLFQDKLLYGDIHPGNFILTKQNKLVVVDFGLCKTDVSELQVELMRKLLDTSEVDFSNIVDCYKKLGASFKNKDEFIKKVIAPYKEVSDQIFGQPCFDFSNQFELIKKLNSVILKQSFNPDLAHFSSDFSLFHRSLQSLLLMMCKFNASINTEI